MLRYPVSNMQRMYWLLYDAFEGPVPPFHTGGALYFVGPLDVEAIAKGFELACAAHQALSARFEVIDGVIEQTFGAGPPPLARSDLTAPARDERLHAAAAIVRECLTARFALDAGEAPIRAHLVLLSSDEAVLAVVVHHIVSDMRSAQIFNETLLAFYRHLTRGDEPPPPFPKYTEYLDAEAAVKAAPDYAERREFWRRSLEGAASVADGAPGGAMEWLDAPQRTDLQARTVAEAKRLGVRNSAVVLARVGRAIARRFGAKDTTIAVFTMNREPRFAQLFGCLAQWLPVRFQIDPELALDEAARRANAALERSFARMLPVGEIASAAHTPRLFDAAMCVNWMPGIARAPAPAPGSRVVELARAVTPDGYQLFAPAEIGDLHVAHYAIRQAMTRLTVGMWLFPHAVTCRYDPRRISARAAQTMIDDFTEGLDGR